MGDIAMKLKTVALVAGVALAVVACGDKKAADTNTVTTTTTTDTMKTEEKK